MLRRSGSTISPSGVPDRGKMEGCDEAIRSLVGDGNTPLVRMAAIGFLYRRGDPALSAILRSLLRERPVDRDMPLRRLAKRLLADPEG